MGNKNLLLTAQSRSCEH